MASMDRGENHRGLTVLTLLFLFWVKSLEKRFVVILSCNEDLNREFCEQFNGDCKECIEELIKWDGSIPFYVEKVVDDELEVAKYNVEQVYVDVVQARKQEISAMRLLDKLEEVQDKLGTALDTLESITK